MRHWGIAEGLLDLETGYLDLTNLSIVEPKEQKSKQVRTNSIDMTIAEQLYEAAFPAAKRAKAIFVEVPVGSQSASGMKAYGMCVGVLGSMRVNGIQLIEVTAQEVKFALSGLKLATKEQMIAAGVSLYPNANWPRHRGVVVARAEHCADAVGAIHAGVNTPVFQNMLRLFGATT